MQSTDYVPGVSGWKIDPASGAFEMASDRVAVVGTDPKAIYTGRSRPKEPNPFVVIDGVTYISQAEVERASIASLNNHHMWSVKMQITQDGKYVAAGVGLDSQFLVSAEKFAIKEPGEFEKARGKWADAVLEFIGNIIKDTDLGATLSSPIADQVRDVIRAEIKPGGLLHRN
ncbi:DUF1983 domain-containing protein [Pseudomonas sp. ANT_J28]|nr:DUF1983 domain-containing protein [Pseudomonas sp. ANT_J28]KAA0983310.1 DUF1983 domain-containing protein [Pseudomonas sp. ANT_J28]